MPRLQLKVPLNSPVESIELRFLDTYLATPDTKTPLQYFQTVRRFGDQMAGLDRDWLQREQSTPLSRYRDLVADLRPDALLLTPSSRADAMPFFALTVNLFRSASVVARFEKDDVRCGVMGLRLRRRCRTTRLQSKSSRVSWLRQ